MTSRRPLQPIPALSANVLSTRYARITTTTTASKATDGHVEMEDHVQDDVQDAGSVVSGLTSLSGEDEFERLMIQNARDERRLNEARNGRGQPFRKARTHARVGLTLDNLERNDAQNHNSAPTTTARVAIKSPPSSSGSTRSDPAIHAPAGWGRKGRPARNWMRSITRDEQPRQTRQTPAPPNDTLHEPHGQHGDSAPHRSMEDSPLSHKSFNQGTRANDDSGSFDLTFDMPDASIIASTPYIPRNTKLDDIREREIESLREQGVATARLDRIRENSPEEMRRPRSSTGRSINNVGTGDIDVRWQEQGSPTRRLHKRTNSWQSLSKSQPELTHENAPIAVYQKSVETVGVVERDVVASAERQPARPISNRRTDSQDLLRRLARVSNTPSPKAVAPRPQPAPATQPQSSSQAAGTNTSCTKPVEDMAANETPAQGNAATSMSTSNERLQREQRQDTPHDGTTPDVPSSAPATENVDVTPMPADHTVLNPKTPLVMGGWIDTPGPRTAHKPIESPRPRSQSPNKGSLRKTRSQERPTAPAEQQQPVAEAQEAAQPSLPRPQLPSSALHALVQEARASHDYGEDTIHSLEDLITPLGENEVEEDTLQGLSLPTSAPRNEAERERQAEVVNLHRLNQHLRATSTSIRDASRGMRRVETRMEHIEVAETGEKVPVIVRNLSPEFSPWTWFSSFFWDERLKTQRHVNKAPLKLWGGVTLLGILLTVSFIWWASETVAWYVLSLPIFILLSVD